MESRGQGCQSNCLYIYEFVEEAQDAAAAWEEGDKTELVEEKIEPLRTLLDWRMSGRWV